MYTYSNKIKTTRIIYSSCLNLTLLNFIYLFLAIISISTFALRGSPATAIVVLAG